MHYQSVTHKLLKRGLMPMDGTVVWLLTTAIHSALKSEKSAFGKYISSKQVLCTTYIIYFLSKDQILPSVIWIGACQNQDVSSHKLMQFFFHFRALCFTNEALYQIQLNLAPHMHFVLLFFSDPQHCFFFRWNQAEMHTTLVGSNSYYWRQNLISR